MGSFCQDEFNSHMIAIWRGHRVLGEWKAELQGAGLSSQSEDAPSSRAQRSQP